ncbi:MAG: TetR/AcrR family transcriptional regulator [Endomicrobium sp.]|jgi:AcrR family transcriptional regulator|nr:TetR/AcrR family transcriptional regulator [Endomicrobium sp.]
MVRPSQNLNKKLIELGKEKIISYGIANLSIRQICLDGKINLGMFYYYFKSKENFIKAILRSLNNDLAAIWIVQSEKLSSSVEKLKKVLLINVKMIREKHGMIETLIKDTNIFDKFYVEIGKEMYSSWIKFYSNLINECKNDGYLDKNIDTDILIAIITGAVHSYAKKYNFCDYDDEKTYYADIEKMIDFIMEKFK